MCPENECLSETENDINEEVSKNESEAAKKPKNALNENFSIEWRKRQFTPVIHNFDDSNSGARVENIEKPSKEMDYFLLFMNDEVVEMIISETNKYASEQTRLNKNIIWSPITKEIFFNFIAALLLAARHRKNKLVENWSTDELL